jgi:hypothetical protein
MYVGPFSVPLTILYAYLNDLNSQQFIPIL